MSVRARRRACASESGGLNRATSTANLWTTVKAARWCRNAISALGYMASLLTSVRRAVRGLCGRSGFGVIPGGGFQRFEAAFKVGTELSVHVQEHSHDLQSQRLLPAPGPGHLRRGTRGLERELIDVVADEGLFEVCRHGERPRCQRGGDLHTALPGAAAAAPLAHRSQAGVSCPVAALKRRILLILRRPGAPAVEISNEREHPLSRCRNGNGALDQQHVGSLRGEDE